MMYMSLHPLITDSTGIDYNLGNTIYRLSYLLSEVPAQMIGKYMGADIWIPLQMTCWSIVACCQFWLQGRGSFLACRALIGVLSGGFTPTVSNASVIYRDDAHLMQMILYLSYFYKHHELSIRLGFWYAGSSFADILAGVLAYGILHMGGTDGRAGWRWLFLIEVCCVLSLAVCCITDRT